MKTTHDLITNIRLWSVQAGVVGGALTGMIGTLQASGVAIPPLAIDVLRTALINYSLCQ